MKLRPLHHLSGGNVCVVFLDSARMDVIMIHQASMKSEEYKLLESQKSILWEIFLGFSTIQVPGREQNKCNWQWSNGERTWVLLGIKRICRKGGTNTGSQVPVFTNQISVMYQFISKLSWNNKKVLPKMSCCYAFATAHLPQSSVG